MDCFLINGALLPFPGMVYSPSSSRTLDPQLNAVSDAAIPARKCFPIDFIKKEDGDKLITLLIKMHSCNYQAVAVLEVSDGTENESQK